MAFNISQYFNSVFKKILKSGDLLSHIFRTAVIASFLSVATIIGGTFLFLYSYAPVVEAADSANTFYVSRNGDNTTGTSWATAWNELDQIQWSSISAGSTIYLDGGVSGMTYATDLVTEKSGTASQRITFTRSDASGHGGTVTITGTLVMYNGYITVDGLDYQKFRMERTSGGWNIVETSTDENLLVDSLEFKNIYFFGRRSGNSPSGCTGNLMRFLPGVGDVLIENSYFDGTPYEDQIKYNGHEKLTVRNNVFTNIYGADVPGCTATHSDVIQFYGNNYSLDFYNNLVFDSADVLISQGDNAQNFLLHHNVFADNADALKFSSGVASVKVYNNTFRNNRAVIFGTGVSNSGLDARNNIFSGHSPWGDTNSVFVQDGTFNLWDAGAPGFPGGQNVQGSAQFINTANTLGADGIPFTTDDGFNIQSGSAAINTGTSVGYPSDILGSATVGLPDIGAYEFTGSSTPPPTTYTLTITASNGTVAKSPNQSSYASGAAVTLTATPSSGYTFSGWSGDLTGSTNPATVTMNGNKTITASFTAISSCTNCHFVRQGATGNNSGSDWTNAFTSIPANPTRGHTYYVASGNYAPSGGIALGTSGSTVTIIKGATIADHGTGTGWSNSFSVCSSEGGTQAQFPNGWDISTGGWTIDGSCGAGSANNGTTTGYGFRSRSDAAGSGAIGFWFANSVSGIAISHYEIDGVSATGIPIDQGGTDGMLCAGGCDVDGVFDHLYIHDIKRAPFLMGGNVTLQYSYLARNRSTAPEHAEGWSYRGGTAIVRWNVFEDIRGTGQFVQLYGVGTNHEIYGNVFKLVAGPCNQCSASAFPVVDATGDGVIHGLKFYNNTIYNFNGNPGVASINGSDGYDVKNNLWLNSDYGASISGTENYNNIWGAYFYDRPAGAESSWRCIQSTGQDPSGNCAGVNNTLVAPSPSAVFVSAPNNLHVNGNTISGLTMLGTNLGGAPYNVDMDGNTRTNWTRGAYEFTGSSTPPPAPTTYTLTITASNGTVAKSPNQTSYTSGTAVTLTATPSSSYTFSGWSGDLTGSTNPATVTMNANKNITASFTATAPTPPPTPGSGLLVALGFDEGAGSTTADASGNGNNGTIGGATWNTSGKFGKNLSFNGTSNLVNVSDVASLDLTNGMTLEAWIFPTASGGYRAVIMKQDTGTSPRIDLVYSLYASSPSTNPGSYVFSGSNRLTSVEPTGKTLPLNTWSHLATTYNGSTVILYVNGIEAKRVNASGNILGTALPLRIGGNGLYSEYFKGQIDEVRVYNRVLSAAEVAEIGFGYTAHLFFGLPRTGRPLLA